MKNKIKVTYFQRKSRPGSNFSLEYIFDDIRNRLSDVVEAKVVISPLQNDGYYSKLVNILDAWKNESRSVNHIAGEVHFLDLLMKKRKVVLTILDCCVMDRKKGVALTIMKQLYLVWPVRKAEYVTAISEATKREIIQYAGCAADKVHVIPVAVSPMYKPAPRDFNQTRPNILHIGTSYNKNLLRLAQALEGLDCKLTIIGKLSREQENELKIRNISYENKYNITPEEMYKQYVDCDMLAFASTSEGFGMPIVEANAVERPVVTGNVTSMPEVAGDAACLVDPYNVNDIRRGIEYVINDSRYREQLIQNGRRNRMRFDADTIVDSYYQLYRKIQNAG